LIRGFAVEHAPMPLRIDERVANVILAHFAPQPRHRSAAGRDHLHQPVAIGVGHQQRPFDRLDLTFQAANAIEQLGLLARQVSYAK